MLERPAGLVVLGSGAIPLASARDLRDLVAAAGAESRVALANNRYSADVVAIARPWPTLDGLPDLPSDNALPRWLGEARATKSAICEADGSSRSTSTSHSTSCSSGTLRMHAMDLGASHAAIARVKAVALRSGR